MPIPVDLYSKKKAEDIVNRVNELLYANHDTADSRQKTKDIMDGGPAGISRLVGRDIANEKVSDLLPVANMMLKSNDRIGQKIGKYPLPRISTPSEDEKPQKRADKRVKMLGSWDRAAKVPMMLHQVGRWLPGYGLTAGVLSIRNDVNRDPYPHIGFRDPFNTFPAPWTVDQQPRDIAFRHVISANDLRRLNEDAYNAVTTNKLYRETGSPTGYLPRAMGGVVLSPGGVTGAGWANQNGDGIEVYEYIDESGTYWVHPGYNQLLAYVPNPLYSGPMFHCMKRFAFNKLQGQYDQMIGLMAAVVRINLLSIMALERGINAETVVIGQMAAGQYSTGPGAINHMLQGSDVKKMNDRIPFEALQILERMESQVRAMATYPVTDDGISPNSFVTGLGLEELGSSVSEEVSEYHMIVGDGLENFDYKRFEAAEELMKGRSYQMWGEVKGSSYMERYRPDTDINGERITKRSYGLMGAWDDQNKLVVGMGLTQNEIFSKEFFRDNIEGIGETEKIKDQLHQERVHNVLMQMLMTAVSDPASPQYQASIEALIEQLPEGDEKELFKRLFMQEPEEQQQELTAALGGGAGATGQGPGGGVTGPIPPTTTILNRLTNQSQPTVGVQTVQQV